VEMETLRQQAEGKLTNRHLMLDDDDEFFGDEDEFDENGEPVKKKRKRAVASRTKVARVPSKNRAIDTHNIMVETHDLKDKVVVVEPANAKLKARLEAVVVKYGGKIEQNVKDGRTFCYVETGYKVKAKNVALSKKFDVVRSNWLVDCEVEFRPLRPADLIVMTESTAERFAGAYDKYGDGYAERATLASLKHSMVRVKELGDEIRMSHALKAEFESRYFADGAYKFGLFRQCVVYADIDDPEMHPLNLVVATVRFYGGRIVKELEAGVTHVLTHSSDSRRLEELKGVRRNRREKFHIVGERWVDDCLEGQCLVQEKEYEY
jgi:hypothetical protein